MKLRTAISVWVLAFVCGYGSAEAQTRRTLDAIAADVERLAAELRLPEAPPLVTDNLAGHLSIAAPGSTLRLSGTFTGNFTTNEVSLEGGRLVSPNGSPALVITGTGVTLSNVYVGSAPGAVTNDLVVNRGTQVTLQDVEIEGNGATKRGLAANGTNQTLLRVHIHHIGRKGQESQAVAMWDGTGLTIRQSVLAAGSTPLLVGGSDPTVPNMIPSDILVEDSLLTHHDEWRGQGYVNKTGFELKSARRVVVRRTTIEKVWVDGQTAWGITLTPVNQGGNSPETIVEDVLFEDVTVREVGGGANILGFTQETTRPTLRLQNVTFRGCRFEISRATHGGHGSLMQLGREPWGLTWVNNIVTQDGEAFIRTADSKPIPGFVFTGNTVTTNVAVAANIYGIWTPIGSRGGAWVATVFPGIDISVNDFVGSHSAFRTQFPNNTYR